MKKQEAIGYIRRQVGFVPHIKLFDLYSDDEEIPEWFFKMLLQPPKPREYRMILSPKIYKDFIKAVNEHS